MEKSRCGAKILEQLADKPDDEWLMIEASQIKVHPPAVGAVKGNLKMSRTKGGSTADCSQAEELRPGIQAQYLLADRGYDSQAILPRANQAEIWPVIRPKKKRKYQRNYNQD